MKTSLFSENIYLFLDLNRTSLFSKPIIYGCGRIMEKSQITTYN